VNPSIVGLSVALVIALVVAIHARIRVHMLTNEMAEMRAWVSRRASAPTPLATDRVLRYRASRRQHPVGRA
jgi:uncharacterized protein HemY